MIEHMFELMGGVPEDWVPEDWEPIPATEWASLAPLPADGLPAGLSAEEVDSCDRLVDRAVAAGPGAAALGWLTAVPVKVLSEAARSRALVELTALSAHVAAVNLEFTAVIAGPAPKTLAGRRDDSDAANEIAVATRSSVYAADHLIALARDLATVLRASRAAMRAGTLSLAQARVLHHATAGLPAALTRTVEARVLPRAGLQSTRNFTRSVDRAIAALDPNFTPRSKTARAEVEVSHTAFGDGVGQLYIRGPLEITATINLALTAHAEKTKPTLGGTIDQRKLAGLRDWAETAHDAPDTPTHHGRVPAVNVTIDLATLLGLRNHPAEIPGLGPLPPDAARWLLADGAPLRRLITDPLTGALLDYGTDTYTAPPDLADYLIAQNITSAAPHATIAAHLCDMEHNTPHHHGGPTNPINVTPVERRWHRPKTHKNWTYLKHPDNTITWTSPTGLTCQINPYDYRTGP
jgi:hypothetical protein